MLVADSICISLGSNLGVGVRDSNRDRDRDRAHSGRLMREAVIGQEPLSLLRNRYLSLRAHRALPVLGIPILLRRVFAEWCVFLSLINSFLIRTFSLPSS